ncbi:MAG TPA: DUF4058 family protein [Pirellulales bacterium]|nr:DUF4058 family protein [Pirellulales bacterium]
MRSPFPGMDPYLEDPAFWPDFHHEFIGALRHEIKAVLPKNYEARLDERVALVEAVPADAKEILPDVAVLRRGEHSSALPASSGGLLIEPVSLLLFAEEEIRDVWIEIRRRPDRELVTVVEVLSPWNKMGAGRYEYLAKRRALGHQSVHLVELDLLVGGERVAAAQTLPNGDYFALVSRSDARPRGNVYGWTVRQELPSLPVPLADPDPDVIVTLQTAFAAAFERGDYGELIDYSQPPKAPLAESEFQWATEHARCGDR